MKTLQAFWHWVDNEKPSLTDYAERGLKNVSPLALESLMHAERIVSARTGHAGQKVPDEEVMRFRPAIRELSLSLCSALGRMHEQVEKDCLKPPPSDETKLPWYRRKTSDFDPAEIQQRMDRLLSQQRDQMMQAAFAAPPFRANLDLGSQPSYSIQLPPVVDKRAKPT